MPSRFAGRLAGRGCSDAATTGAPRPVGAVAFRWSSGWSQMLGCSDNRGATVWRLASLVASCSACSLLCSPSCSGGWGTLGAAQWVPSRFAGRLAGRGCSDAATTCRSTGPSHQLFILHQYICTTSGDTPENFRDRFSAVISSRTALRACNA